MIALRPRCGHNDRKPTPHDLRPSNADGSHWFARSGDGCEIRLYLTITRVRGLFDRSRRSHRADPTGETALDPTRITQCAGFGDGDGGGDGSSEAGNGQGATGKGQRMPGERGSGSGDGDGDGLWSGWGVAVLGTPQGRKARWFSSPLATDHHAPSTPLRLPSPSPSPLPDPRSPGIRCPLPVAPCPFPASELPSPPPSPSPKPAHCVNRPAVRPRRCTRGGTPPDRAPAREAALGACDRRLR